MISKWKYRFKTFFHYRDLLKLLVARDLKLKYRRSFLGYIWSVLNPLLSMLVQAWVFSNMFSKKLEHFPVFLIIGNIMFSFMRESTTQAMNSIVGNASLLKKVYVPKYIFTLSKVTSCLVNFVLSLGALVIVCTLDHVKFTPYALLSVIPIMELYVFNLGLGLLLAAGNVYFRDISNIWGVVCMAWSYLTPIFYDIDSLSGTLRYWIPKVNPMYIYITQMRDFIIKGSWCWKALCWRGAFVSVVMLAVGLFVFDKTKNKFILFI